MTKKKSPAKKRVVKKASAGKRVKKKTAAKKQSPRQTTAKKKVTKKKVAKTTKKTAKKPTSKKVAKKAAAKKRPTKKASRSKSAKQANGSSAPMDGDWLPEGYEPRVDLKKGYKPVAKEEYMGPAQLEYFRRKLYRWRQELVDESQQTIDHLRSEVRDVGDEAERATRETENSLELRTRDRYRKLIRKVDQAIKRIDDGSYGYCEETDEEIGLARLEARPIATLSLDAQERWELKQRQLSK